MAQYKIIKPINAGSGYLKDINGNMVSMQSLAPKVGDIINGTIETKYIFNKYMTGISFPITTGSNDKAGNSAIFIPKDSVEVYNIGYTMRPADIPPAPNYYKYTLTSDYKAVYPEPACRKQPIACQVAVPPPRLFKKGEVIEGTPKFASVQAQCIKAPCPPINGTNLVGISTRDGLTIPMNVLSPVNKDAQAQEQPQPNKQKIESRDAWTGGIEWDKIFSVKNLLYLVLLVYLAYLFMKYVLPLAKKSFGKSA